jgi:hypothetical protein
MDGSGESLVDAEYSPESRHAFQVHPQLLGTFQIEHRLLCELSGNTLSVIE